MNESCVVMPFGKHRDRPLSAVDSGYLRWCLRTCWNLAPTLRRAIHAELERRGSGHERRPPAGPGAVVATAVAPTAPPASDRPAVLALLADLLAAAPGVRIVASGEGAIHILGVRRLPATLHDRLRRHLADLDRLASWVRWESPGRPRRTPAADLLQRMRAAGVAVSAKPDGGITLPPASPYHDAVAALTPAGVRELCFRIIVNMPDPSAPDAATAASRAGCPGNSLAGLHRLCQRRAATAAHSADPAAASTWRRFADAVAAVRAGQAAPADAVLGLASHCREHAAAMARRCGVAARRWRGWAASLEGLATARA